MRRRIKKVKLYKIKKIYLRILMYFIRSRCLVLTFVVLRSTVMLALPYEFSASQFSTTLHCEPRWRCWISILFVHLDPPCFILCRHPLKYATHLRRKILLPEQSTMQVRDAGHDPLVILACKTKTHASAENTKF